MSEAEILKRVKRIEDEVKKIKATIDNIEMEVSGLERKGDVSTNKILEKLEDLDTAIRNIEQ